MFDIVDAAYDLIAPWRNIGLARESPLISIRSSLRVVVFDEVIGSWSILERLGVGTQFSFAMMQYGAGHLVVNVGPAAIDYMAVRVQSDEFRGRVDVSLLGEMRVLEVGS